MKLMVGTLLGLIVIGVVLWAVLALGLYNVAASAQPAGLDRILNWAKLRSVHRHADKTFTASKDPAAIARGLEHYQYACVYCHGAPGVEPLEFAPELHPDAPEIDAPLVQGYSDGELLWIVRYGIGMTGMPGFGRSHDENDLRDIVAFVRHAPHVTETEKQALRAAVAQAQGGHHGEGEHHHEGEDEHSETVPHH